VERWSVRHGARGAGAKIASYPDMGLKFSNKPMVYSVPAKNWHYKNNMIVYAWIIKFMHDRCNFGSALRSCEQR